MKVSFVLLAMLQLAHSANYSGRVINTDGSYKPGVKVVLLGSNDSSITNSKGEWSLAKYVTSVYQNPKQTKRLEGLFNDGAASQLLFMGYSVIGTKNRLITTPFFKVNPAARRLSTIDTLVFSFGGKAFWKDTVSTSTADILTTFDSTWQPNIYGTINHGELYRTIKIGEQEWFAQNYASSEITTEGRAGYCYGGMPIPCTIYGRLYLYTMTKNEDYPNDSSSYLCPPGWRLPLPADWDTLIQFVERDPRVGKGNAGRALKATVLWSHSDTALSGWDLFGFRALPAGSHYSDGQSMDLGNKTTWWSDRFVSGSRAEVRFITSTSNSIQMTTQGKFNGAFSVRCVRR